MTLLLILIVLFFAFAITVILAIFVIGPVMLLNPRRRGEEYYRAHGAPVSPADVGLGCEEFWFTGDGGVPLHAWLIRADLPASGTILYLHGVGDNKISGLRLAREFHDGRYHVFLYDSRAHGRSGGRYCTYGYHEKRDVGKAIDAVTERLGAAAAPFCLFGTSMGAAIAVQAAAIEPRVAAVIAEGCFTNLRTITVDYQRRLLRLPWHFLRNIVMKRSEYLAAFRHREVSPLTAVSNVRVPVLFIHGKGDTFIKYQYTEELYAAARTPK